MIYIKDGRDKFYQWDKEQKLVIDNAAAVEVHFTNATHTEALVCEIYEENGARVVNVPNILLTDYWNITAFAVCDLCTRETAVFQVEKRVKPTDYVYTETEVKNWEDLEATVSEAVAQVEATAANVERELSAISEEITEVNDKFNELPNLYCAALKANKTDKVFYIDDLIEGNGVVVSSNEYPNSVKKMGKNLIDYQSMYPKMEDTGNSLFHKFENYEGEVDYYLPEYEIPEQYVGKTLTISALFRRYSTVAAENGIDTRVRINIVRNGGSLKSPLVCAGGVDAYEQTKLTFTVEKGDKIKIILAYPKYGLNIKNMMLSFSTNTDYEPYMGMLYSLYKPLKIGSVKDGETLFSNSEDKDITVEYNRDINKVIAKLEGGN